MLWFCEALVLLPETKLENAIVIICVCFFQFGKRDTKHYFQDINYLHTITTKHITIIILYSTVDVNIFKEGLHVLPITKNCSKATQTSLLIDSIVYYLVIGLYVDKNTLIKVQQYRCFKGLACRPISEIWHDESPKVCAGRQ